MNQKEITARITLTVTEESKFAKVNEEIKNAQVTFEEQIDVVEEPIGEDLIEGSKIKINRARLYPVLDVFASYLVGEEDGSIIDLRRLSRYSVIRNMEDLSIQERIAFADEFSLKSYRLARQVVSQYKIGVNRPMLLRAINAMGKYIAGNIDDSIKDLKMLRNKLKIGDIDGDIEILKQEYVEAMYKAVRMSV